ncbi:uncharacterized protein LOC108737545 isoform X2 [Agrilus planipennis]|uniref:E3 ubiquitin-protein ligase n=1 Tax=Agrilus planipennis TaxID=224129 RepID=A0A1W4WPV8_AGRPL|nr:uncharacterized protein LOC108737545 isoform X2 [Agrilus planipennis]
MAGISWYQANGITITTERCKVEAQVPLCSLADVQLRFLCPNDLGEVRALCQELFPIEYPLSWYEDITSSQRFYALAAVYNQVIIGLIVAEIKPFLCLNSEDMGILSKSFIKSADVGYILSLGVVRQYRRNGIATLLLDSLIKYLTSTEKKKVKAVFLHVLTTNSAAILFYERRNVRLKLFLYLMAEASSVVVNGDELDKQKDVNLPECAVCLQTCVHPSELPCGHVFCFLCIKGMANQSKRCAMCRQEIPRDFVDRPKLLQSPDNAESYDDGYQWFYEGRNGWWQYDERTSKELETSYKEGKSTCELLIAGFLYVVDLECMIQMRKTDPLRRRRIKRDLATVPKKGVAGLRIDTDLSEYIINHSETQSSSSQVDRQTDNLIPITPTNTPQTPVSGEESPQVDDVETTMERIRTLRLEVNESRPHYMLDNGYEEENS